jgi:CubicO group peptidase (beta-lactamase class C family)
MRAKPWLCLSIALVAACGNWKLPALDGDRVVRGDLGARLHRDLSARVDSGFNGAVLIVQGDAVVLHQAYGWADAQRTVPVTTATPFWIASVSKQFAAAAVLALAEDGRLSVRDSLPRFFTEVPADKRAITLHQLLTHTAGLEQHYAADGIAAREAAVRAILAQPLARPPGTGFGYSNDAYNLVAAIVEIVSGQAYEAFLRQRLLEPAGLAHTGFWGPAAHPEVAAILGETPADPAMARPNWGYRGGVGMSSTAADLYRWYAALAEHRVLAAASVAQLLAPHLPRGDLGIAYGWFVEAKPGEPPSLWTRGYEGFGHGAVLAVYPRHRLVIALTTNSGERAGGPVSHALAAELARSVLERR